MLLNEYPKYYFGAMCDAANEQDKFDDSRSFYERRFDCSSEDMPVLTPQTLCSAMATNYYRKDMSTKLLPKMLLLATSYRKLLAKSAAHRFGFL